MIYGLRLSVIMLGGVEGEEGCGIWAFVFYFSFFFFALGLLMIYNECRLSIW